MNTKTVNIYNMTNGKLTEVARIVNKHSKSHKVTNNKVNKMYMAVVLGTMFISKLYIEQQKELEDIRREIDKLKGR